MRSYDFKLKYSLKLGLFCFISCQKARLYFEMIKLCPKVEFCIANENRMIELKKVVDKDNILMYNTFCVTENLTFF